MDQFLSSISESQPDVTVSSEESVEVPVSEGKPYRPIQVTSLGSRSEPEGEQLQPRTQSQAASWAAVWLCREHTHKSLWRTLVTTRSRTVAQQGRIGLQCVLCQWKCAVEPVLWTYLCLHSSPWPPLQRRAREVQINAQSLRLCCWVGARSLWGKMSSYDFPLCHIHAKQKTEFSRREKSDGWSISSEMEEKLWENPKGTFNTRANTPEGSDRVSQSWNGSVIFFIYLCFLLLFFEFGYLSNLFSDSSLLDSFPNQLTQLDNPAFLFSLQFSLFFPSPFLFFFFFSVAHF